VKESDLQKSVCDFLDLVCPEVFYFHVANSSIMAQVIINIIGEEKGRIIIARFVNFLKKIGLKPGTPDLVLCFKPQRVVFIECKTSEGRLSGDQKVVKEKLEWLGWNFHIVRSLSDLRAVIKSEGLPSRESKNVTQISQPPSKF